MGTDTYWELLGGILGAMQGGIPAIKRNKIEDPAGMAHLTTLLFSMAKGPGLRTMEALWSHGEERCTRTPPSRTGERTTEHRIIPEHAKSRLQATHTLGNANLALPLTMVMIMDEKKVRCLGLAQDRFLLKKCLQPLPRKSLYSEERRAEQYEASPKQDHYDDDENYFKSGQGNGRGSIVKHRFPNWVPWICEDATKHTFEGTRFGKELLGGLVITTINVDVVSGNSLRS